MVLRHTVPLCGERLLVDSSVRCLWLFSLTARRNLRVCNDVGMERMVKGFNCAWVPKKSRCQVTYFTYLSSGRWLSYTPSVECVVGWAMGKHSLFSKFLPFSDYVTTRKKRYQALPGFPYCDGKLSGAWERSYNFCCLQALCKHWNLAVALHNYLATIPGLLSPNPVEGLVKLLT